MYGWSSLKCKSSHQAEYNLNIHLRKYFHLKLLCYLQDIDLHTWIHFSRVDQSSRHMKKHTTSAWLSKSSLFLERLSRKTRKRIHEGWDLKSRRNLCFDKRPCTQILLRTAELLDRPACIDVGSRRRWCCSFVCSSYPIPPLQNTNTTGSKTFHKLSHCSKRRSSHTFSYFCSKTEGHTTCTTRTHFISSPDKEIRKYVSQEMKTKVRLSCTTLCTCSSHL